MKEIHYLYNMKFKNVIYSLLLLFSFTIISSCHKGVGCPADQYNDWKKIEANRKQQLKSPKDPHKGSKRGKPKVEGNGVVPH
ncbi:MAG: hypothetical protein RJA25_637 [Bacteroidota bacterium]|jgi:hypothetical protein